MNIIRILILALLYNFTFSSALFGQENLLYNIVQKHKTQGNSFSEVSKVLQVESVEKANGDNFHNSEEVYFLEYSSPDIEILTTAISLTIPTTDKMIHLELLEVPPSFYGYIVTTSDGKTYSPNPKNRHYRGIVKDDPKSVVAISFLEDEIMGLISTDEGNLNLALVRDLNIHVLYNDNNLKERPKFECGTVHDSQITEKYRNEVLEDESRSLQSEAGCVRFYFETEYDIFQTRGSVLAVEGFIIGLYNQVGVLYQNENIETIVSEIHIWTSQDPYTATNVTNLLNQFQNQTSTLNGDLGQLLTFRNVGGGKAAGFNGLCNSDVDKRLAVSGILNNFATVPNYSFSVQVITHEFGHLFGSRHTHDCVWNGNNTAIDGCAPTWTCTRPGNPSGGGTIMSYCHTQSVGINFNLGFGPQPGNVIRNSYNNATCLCDCYTGNVSGPDLLCSTNSFSLNNFPSGSTANWIVQPSHLFSGNTLGSGTTASLTPYHSSTSGQATLIFTIEDSSCGTTIVGKTFWVGRPATPGSIFGDSSPNIGSYKQYLVSGLSAGASSMQWILPYCFGCSEPWGFYSGQNSSQMVAIVGEPSGYIQVMGTNSCGNGGVSLLYVSPQSDGGGCDPCPRIYPNPTSDELILEWEFKNEVQFNNDVYRYEVTLYDVQGAILLSEKSKSPVLRMDLRNLKNGFYYIHIMNKEGLIRKQIRIER